MNTATTAIVIMRPQLAGTRPRAQDSLPLTAPEGDMSAHILGREERQFHNHTSSPVFTDERKGSVRRLQGTC